MVDKDGVVEVQNRTTVYGILAIVVVVIVVAVSLKVRPSPLFADAADNSIQGFAVADSFYGTYTVPLAKHPFLSARISLADVGARRYRAFVNDGRLIVDKGSSRYEAPLLAQGDTLVSTYPDAGQEVAVVVNPDISTLFVRGLTPFLLTAPLTPGAIWDGELIVRGHEIYLQHETGSNGLLFVVDDVVMTVPLTEREESFVGTWSWDGVDHPVTLDPVTRSVKIENLY